MAAPGTDSLIENRFKQELQGLVKRQKRYESLLKEGKARMAQQAAQIKELEQELEQELLVKIQGIDNYKTNRKLRALQVELNRLSNQLAVTVTSNAQLRGDIDWLIFQKEKYGRLSLKLEKQLMAQKADIHAAKARAKREHAIKAKIDATTQAHKECEVRELHLYNELIDRLTLRLGQETKLKEFMSIKLCDRTKATDYKTKLKREALATQKPKLEKEEMAKRCRQIYLELQQLLGEKNLECFGQHYENTEEEILANFILSNELYSDVERLQAKIRSVEEEIVHFTHLCNKDVEELQLNVRHLEKEYQTASAEIEKCRKENTKVSKSLDKLIAKIDILFKIIDCDPSPIETVLGGGQGIASHNVIQYLCIIEEKINQLQKTETCKKLLQVKDLHSPHSYAHEVNSRVMYLPDMEDQEDDKSEPQILEYSELKQLALNSILENEKNLGTKPELVTERTKKK